MATTVRDTQTRDAWQIDASHSSVEFAVKHLMIATVRGRFGELTGTIELDDMDLANSGVSVEIDVASIDTRQPQRDGHLRSADFFDVENHPRITYRSRAVEILGEDRFRVVGDLTIRDVTREVVLDVRDAGRARDPWGGERAAFTAATAFDRRDFGLTWNQALEAGGLVVGEEVRITLEVEAVRQPTAAAA